MDNRYADGFDVQADTKDISSETLAAHLQRVYDIGRGMGSPAIAATVDASVRPFFIPRQEA